MAHAQVDRHDFAVCKSWLQRRQARSLGAGYVVLVLFGIAAGLARWALSTSPRTALVAAAVFISPFAFAWLNGRITSVKALGIEVSLHEVTVRVDADVSGAVMVIANTGGSGSPQLLDAFQSAIQNNSRLLQVDLHDDDYWWSTRLFLVAALAFEYTAVEQLLFTRHRHEFVGMASPATVRRQLAAKFPEYEQSYRRMHGKLAEAGTDDEPEGGTQDERAILHAILMAAWSSEFNWQESDVKQVVTSQVLPSWVGDGLDTSSLPDGPLTPLLQFQIISRPVPFTALATNGRLAHVVDRGEVARRIAEAALRLQFQ